MSLYLYRINPDEFVGKMFLTPEDIKEILRMGRSATYNYLNKCEDFAVIRVGTLINILNKEKRYDEIDHVINDKEYKQYNIQ